MNPQNRYELLCRELQADRLIDLAREKTGLSDIGDSSFRMPLAKLLDCAARDINFNAQGLAIFKSEILRYLSNRLRMQEDLKCHPEILNEDVSNPIIIIGLGRSGTTKLQKILSLPDGVQKMWFWRLWNVARFPGEQPGRPAARIAAADFSSLISEDKPDLDAAHHIAGQEVDEDWMLYFYTFEEWGWCAIEPVFSFFDWAMAHPSLDAYRYVKTMVQYLQWQDGGKRGRPWVMKSVGHLAHMDSLAQCYPDAILIHPHRDPRETIPSWCKFLTSVWAIQSNPVDPHLLGKEILRQWSTAMDRYLDARQRLDLDGRILDVSYEQVRAEPMAIVGEVYRRAGVSLTVEEERSIAAWHDGNEQGRFGRHEYTLAEFGLTEADIDKTFGKYIKRFIES